MEVQRFALGTTDAGRHIICGDRGTATLQLAIAADYLTRLTTEAANPS